MNLKNKSIVLASLLTLSLLVYISIRRSNKIESTPFNKVELTNDNWVRSNSEMPYLDTIIKVGLDELELKGIVVVTRKLTNHTNEGLELKAQILGADGSYIIELNQTNRSDMISHVSHELIHLLQMNYGALTVESNYVIWRGDTLYDVPPYELREWEIEAFEMGPILDKKIRKRLILE